MSVRFTIQTKCPPVIRWEQPVVLTESAKISSTHYIEPTLHLDAADRERKMPTFGSAFFRCIAYRSLPIIPNAKWRIRHVLRICCLENRYVCALTTYVRSVSRFSFLRRTTTANNSAIIRVDFTLPIKAHFYISITSQDFSCLTYSGLIV